MRSDILAGAVILIFGASSAVCQEALPKSQSVPLYRVTVVERTIKAVNYNYRNGPTRIDFRGTVLMPDARGEATVESKRGRTVVDVKFEKLLPPQHFGREYLTYVLWAITPEGGPRNIGEIIPGTSNSANLTVTTDLQAFAMIVTAEPYSAVRQPGDAVVLENHLRSDTFGKIQEVTAKYELMPRGHYVLNKDPVDPAVANAPKVSMREYEALTALYQAENAVGIAGAANAQQHAPNTFAKAQQLLAEARQWQTNGKSPRRVVESAREATQTAEDARTIAERRQQAEVVANAAAETAQAQQMKAQAENDVRRARAEAESARTAAETERIARQRAEAEISAIQGGAARPQTEAARGARPLAAPAAPASAASGAQSNLRMRLLEELNGIAVTRDTPRGLVVTMHEEGFQGASLAGPSVDQIARIAGIVAAQPGLRIAVEGHSDNASGEPLSSERAQAVREALMRRGVRSEAVTAQGFGNTRPLVAGGRQNQRVEIVIHGEPIGSLPLWDRTYSLVPQ